MKSNGAEWVTVGKMAHIYAHSPAGARFNPDLSEKEKVSYENTLLLCSDHHDIIDHNMGQDFPAELLIGWRIKNEESLRLNALPVAVVSAAPPLSHLFVERDEIQTNLRQSLATHNRVTLIGQSGSGKSQIAASYFMNAESEYTFRFWLRASTRGMLESDLAAIGGLVGISMANDEATAAISMRVVQALEQMGGWLMVVDDASSAADLLGLLPLGGGHVVCTTQNAGWHGYGITTEIPLLPRATSHEILKMAGVSGVSDSETDSLVDLCGGLPLVVTQVASFVAQSGVSVGTAIALFGADRAEFLETIASGARVTLGHSLREVLARLSPEGLELIHTLAMLAPAPFMLPTLASEAAQIFDHVTSDLLLERALADLRAYSLVERDEGVVAMHELTQDVIRSQMTAFEGFASAMRAASFLAVQMPERTELVTSWTMAEHLLPHVDRLAEHFAGTRELPGWPVATLLNRSSTYMRHQAKQDISRQMLESAIGLIGQDSDQASTGTLGSLKHNLANLLMDDGDLAGAEAMMREAIELKSAADGDEAWLVGLAHAALAVIVEHRGRRSEAVTHHQTALGIYRSSDRAELIADCLCDLAECAIADGHLVEAGTMLEEAVRICERSTELWPEHTSALVHYAVWLERSDRLQEALRAAEEARRVAESAAPRSPQLARALATKGRLLGRLGRERSGATLLRVAVDMYSEFEGSTTIDGAMMLGNLGWALFETGEKAAALPLLADSLRDLSRLLPPENETVLRGRYMLGECQIAVGEAAAGIASLAETARLGGGQDFVGAARETLSLLNAYRTVYERLGGVI